MCSSDLGATSLRKALHQLRDHRRAACAEEQHEAEVPCVCSARAQQNQADEREGLRISEVSHPAKRTRRQRALQSADRHQQRFVPHQHSSEFFHGGVLSGGWGDLMKVRQRFSD